MRPELEIEVLKRSTPSGGLDADLRLSPPEWRLFAAVDGRTSLAEFARRFGLSGEAIALVADRLKDAGLLARAEYTSVEYHEMVATAPEPTAEAGAALVPVSAGPRKFSAALRRRPGIAAGARPEAAPSPVEPAPSIAPSTTPPPPVESREADPGRRRESFHLRPLIDFIVSAAGGGTKGQLAVYRVFCKVPNELLLKARITSLNLVGDDFEIQDAQLKARLLEATRAVLGVDYV